MRATHCYGGARARIVALMIFSLLELRDVGAVGEAGVHIVLGVHLPQIEDDRERALLTVWEFELDLAQCDRSVAFGVSVANLIKGDQLVHDHRDEDLLIVDLDLGDLLGLHAVGAVSLDDMLDHGLGGGQLVRVIHHQLDLNGLFVRVVNVGVEPTPVKFLRTSLHQSFYSFELFVGQGAGADRNRSHGLSPCESCLYCGWS